MYLEHFGLRTFPFTTAPDPRFYFASAKHREALACLLYAIQQRKGFALITGEVGSGKSMLCHAALKRLGDSVESAMMVQTSFGPEEFVRAVAVEFGLEEEGKSRVSLMKEFRGFLVAARRQHRVVVLLVDEAQDLSPEALEEVRLLGNLETPTDKLLQIILVGQPELRRAIGTYELRQLDQRIAVKFHLGALSCQDVGAYIDHRLHVAGAEREDLFDTEAKFEVFKTSKGIPRLVNVHCDQAMLLAYVNDEPVVTGETMCRVIEEREGYYMDRDGQVAASDDLPDLPWGMLPRKARVRCPQCRQSIGVYEDEAGHAGICPGCGAVIKIPAGAFADKSAGSRESDSRARTASRRRRSRSVD